MAYIISYLYRTLEVLYEEHKDPRVLHLPLVGSPWPMAGVLVAYLSFVLHYGPKWMENRKPFNLKHIMRLYNALQVVANLALLVSGIPNSYLRKEFSLTCQPIDHTNNEPWMRNLIYISYGYYITKYLDLLDTVFFVLRKKNNQITFLHVYHHAGMVFGVYVFMTFMAGSHCTMLGVINLFIHTVMYAYYFVTSLRPVKEALWWKRHITQLQLMQFGYLMLHFLQAIVRIDCHYPMAVSMVGLIQNLFMFALFFDFYYKAYMRPVRQNTKSQQQSQPQSQSQVTEAATEVKRQQQLLASNCMTQQLPSSSHIFNSNSNSAANNNKSNNTSNATATAKTVAQINNCG